MVDGSDVPVLIELPLSYYPAPVRFSFGWYTVRVIGFLSSTLVLIVLLYEIQTLYERLLGAVLAQRREREARLMTGDAVAATIAHEVRQPLTAMITSADAGFRFLDRSMPNLDRAKEAFKRIVADGNRAGEVVGSIRAIFRKDVRTRTLLDANELIRDALALEHGDLQKHRILVRAEPSTQLPEVRGDRVQLQQVLLNLITNAIHAMAAEDQPRVLCVRSEVYEGDGVVISVADTGTGISSQDVDGYSTRSSQQNQTAWGWVCRSAARSSRHTMAGCGLLRTPSGGRISVYLAHQQFGPPAVRDPGSVIGYSLHASIILREGVIVPAGLGRGLDHPSAVSRDFAA